MPVNRVIDNPRSIALVAVVAVCFGAAGYYGSSFMRKAYTADTAVMIARDDSKSSAGGLASQLGGVASLLGASMGGDTNINESLATLRSRLLVADFLRKYPDRINALYALVGIPANSTAPDHFNVAVDYFMSAVLNVTYDARTAVITLTMTWTDRMQCATWANEYVALANEAMRKRAIDDARDRLKFLREASGKAETLTLQQSIVGLAESQVRAEMMAATRPEFAFRVIDPAVTPPLGSEVRPKTWLITVITGILGAFLAVAGLNLYGRMRAPRETR